MANKKPIVFYNGIFGQLRDTDNILDKHSNSIAIQAESIANSKENSLYFNPTKTIYVDINRLDSYTEIGSITRPYKSLISALNSASVGDIIMVSRGTYEEDIIVPNGVSIINPSLNQVNINGNVTFNGSGSPMKVQGIVFGGSQKTVTFNGTVVVLDSYSTIPIVIGPSAHFTCFNFNIDLDNDNVAVTSNTSLTVLMVGSTIKTPNTKSSIIQTDGTLTLNICEIFSNDTITPTINVTGGTLTIISSQIVNNSLSTSIDLSQSNGNSQSSNMLSGVYSVGDIVCGSTSTIVNNIQFMSGNITGTNLQYPSSNYIQNNSNVNGATLTDALNNLSIAINNI